MTNRTTRPRAVGYVRVSTDRQATDGGGLDLQRDAVRAYCRKAGYRLVEVCSDEGVSGAADQADRDGLACVLEHLRSGAADVAVVYRLDRLARDLVLQEQLLAEVRRLGGRVESTAEGEAAYLADDPDDPSRALIRQVLGAVSQYERSMIALRMRAGRRRKRDAGGYADGSPAFGFRAEGGSLVPDESEQEVLWRIATMRTDGASLRAICDELNAEGVPTKRGGAWHPNTVRRMLDDDARAAERDRRRRVSARAKAAR